MQYVLSVHRGMYGPIGAPSLILYEATPVAGTRQPLDKLGVDGTRTLRVLAWHTNRAGYAEIDLAREPAHP